MSFQKRKKRKFTPLNLSVSEGYVFPNSRKGMTILVSTISIAILGYFLFDAFFRTSRSISAGAISSNHANFEKECASCHELGNAVSDALCSSCHEKTSELTIYDFKAHYLYRSNEFARVSEDSLQKYSDREKPCYSCHVEHKGRKAIITRVPRTKCLACHQYGLSNENHPDFEFARTNAADDSTLLMTHLRHTVFVLRELNGVDELDPLFQMLKAKTMDFAHFFEEACLYCHNPDPDGKNFTNINFDRHCAQCHLKADAIVQGLPKFNPRNPNSPGVETLEQMQARGGPGLAWTYAANSNLVIDEDSEVSKNPVFHKDPWVLENLRQIRKQLFPGNGLTDLLNTTGSVSAHRVDTLYSEALRALQTQADELRNRSELKDQVTKINLLLTRAKERLKLPSPKRTRSTFTTPENGSNGRLSQTQRDGLLQLARDLTAADGPECQKCHVVEDAGITPVQINQDALIKADFNHRAHILQKRCTQCHSGIPIDEKLLKLSVEKYSEFKEKFPQILKLDRAATQNLPRFASCQECHTRRKVSSRCTTCHKFHPNKEHRSKLQLFSQG